MALVYNCDVFYLLFILFLSVLLFFGFDKRTKQNRNLVFFESKQQFDSALKNTFFAYKTDSYDTAFSPYLHINHERLLIELTIDTLSGEEKRVWEYRINNLIFGGKKGADFFYKNPNHDFAHFLLGEIMLNYNPEYIKELYYSYDFFSLQEIASKILRKNNFYPKFDDKKYNVDERDIHNIYTSNKKIVEKFFPEILNRYSINYSGEILLKCYLYKIGEKEYLEKELTRDLNKEERRSINYALNQLDIEINK